MELERKKSGLGSPVYLTLEDMLRQSLVEELNVYGQAYLEHNLPLVQSHSPRGKTKYEVASQFEIDGEAFGSVYCFIDTYQKSIKDEDIALFKSLFQESMNLLIGEVLNNLEKKFNLLATLSPPQTYTDDLANLKNKALGTSYKFIYSQREFDCRLLFNLSKRSL